jgi:hypothetical protein
MADKPGSGSDTIVQQSIVLSCIVDMGRMRPDAVITRLTFSLCTLIAVAVSTWLVLKLRSIQSNEEQPDKPASSCKVRGEAR